MSLLEEILKWSQNELKPWQQDAVRRLFETPKTGLLDQDWDNNTDLESAPFYAADTRDELSFA